MGLLKREMDMTFKDLPIGAEFDFIDRERIHLVSFWKRCRKVSARCYRDTQRVRYQVGSINVEVFNIAS